MELLCTLCVTMRGVCCMPLLQLVEAKMAVAASQEALELARSLLRPAAHAAGLSCARRTTGMRAAWWVGREPPPSSAVFVQRARLRDSATAPLERKAARTCAAAAWAVRIGRRRLPRGRAAGNGSAPSAGSSAENTPARASKRGLAPHRPKAETRGTRARAHEHAKCAQNAHACQLHSHAP